MYVDKYNKDGKPTDFLETSYLQKDTTEVVGAQGFAALNYVLWLKPMKRENKRANLPQRAVA